jgi:hypothetical protein
MEGQKQDSSKATLAEGKVQSTQAQAILPIG